MTIRFIPPIQTLPDGYSSYNKYTSGVFHAYADSSRPDDSGDGLSWATAKKTLTGALSVLPEVSTTHIVVHLKGTHDLATLSSKYLYPAPQIVYGTGGSAGNFIIDGGDEIIVVDGPSSATSSTTTTLTDSTKSWGLDDLLGYAVEILDGPAAGCIYTIQSNTLDTIFVGKTWPDPGMCQYRIIKPATLLTTGSGIGVIYFAGRITGRVSIQRLRVDKNTYLGTIYNLSNSSYIQYADVVFENASVGCPAMNDGIGHILTYMKNDPDNPSSYMSYTKDRRSVAHRGLATTQAAYGNGSGHIAINELCVFRGYITVQSCDRVSVYKGVRCSKFEARDSNLITLGYNNADSTIFIGAASIIGVDLIRSRCVVEGPVEISGCSSHAIQLEDSTFERQDAVLSGSGNAGAGVYLKNRSSVLIKNGYTPTLTGSIGDITFTGSSNDGTWSEVDNNTPVVDLTTLSNVQEVA